MKRREATGWILKSAIFTPVLAGSIQSCQKKLEETVSLGVLDKELHALGNAMVDTILPKTESPSASEVRVVEIMDLLLQDVFDSNTVESFLSGLHQFDENCEAEVGGSFAELDQDQRADFLAPIDQAVMGAKHQEVVPFYYTFKRLCVEIYFLTEQGIKQNLDYQPIPGSYVGDMEMKPGTRVAKGNQM